MRAFHQSRDPAFRIPFGAVPVDAEVRLAVQTDGEGVPVEAVYLGYAYGREHFHAGRLLMTEDSGGGFTIRLRTPGAPSLLFYWFEFECAGTTRFLVRDRELSDGTGRLTDLRPDFRSHERFSQSAFQITVYSDHFDTPEWLRGAVVYQVFPDRFARAASRPPIAYDVVGYRSERIFHEDWNEDVDWRGRPETGYIACDFFGGSLRGIEEHLDYIEGLGATVLYLNPVFEARSNHRYDTADYSRIDPLLGTREDLASLCESARRRGIRVLLDGVFSHTGADSVYFNRLKRYPEIGAYQEATGEGRSRYTSWYTIRNKGGSLHYDSWWGFPELPTVSKDDLSYRAFILGEDGIVRQWLRLGVSGWRLDVSDELPDAFLRDIRRSARQETPDAAILGEVWEDASNKVSYGSFRDFAFGTTHDSVTGYPFRLSLLGWLGYRIDAYRMVNELETIRENYPAPLFHCVMNLIGSHDVPRALTVLSGHPDPGDRDRQAAVRLTPEERERGTDRLRLAAAFQVVYPGAPSVYYGDETGMEGFRDPFNRRTFPWEKTETDLSDWFSLVFTLRRSMPVLRTGDLEIKAETPDLVRMRRFLRDGRDLFGSEAEGPAELVAWFNRSDEAVSVCHAGSEVIVGPLGAAVFADGRRVL
ncbi:MAG: glycoside hydrolase family 13 protein [Clostridia bacterium]|nr:glycoside hydrolase family 13 protein [Clostridia bacterium]